MQPLTLHVHPGPNPWKVALILEHLNLPYKTKIWTTADQKKPPFTTTLNPNGFTPVIEDPNTNIKIWESGAIIQYLLETYDGEYTLTFPPSSALERARVSQFSFFQATFQGPQLSNAFYFGRAQPNQQARDRFVAESLRVLRVLETELEGKQWLVGGKMTVADLAFVPYTWSHELILGDDMPDLPKEFPQVDAWLKRMNALDKVGKIRDEKAKVLAASMAPQMK